MITAAQYFGAKPHTQADEEVAKDLLARVNALIGEAVAAGAFVRVIDPDTGTEISGARGGAGDGGFRVRTSITGRPGSSHKEAKGVDPYDPDSRLDTWLDRFEDGNGGNSKLEAYGLYREHPDATRGGTPEQDWCHLQTRAPGSGRRTFRP